MKTNSISSRRAPSAAAPRVSAPAAAQNPRAPSAAAPRAEAPTFNSRRQAGKGAEAPISGSARALPSCGDSRSTAAPAARPFRGGSAADTCRAPNGRDTLNFRARNACDTLCSPPSPWKLLADRCGLSEVTLRNAFARKPITWQTACRIAKNLEIQAASFRIKPDRRGRKK